MLGARARGLDAATCYFVAALADEPIVAWEAAKGMIAKRDPSVVPILMSFVEYRREPTIRTTAAYVLGRLRESRAAPVLLRAAGSPKSPVDLRDHAIEALTYMGEPRTVKIAEAALRSSDSHVRVSAIYALGELGTRKSAVLLQRIASRAGRSWTDELSAAA